MPLAQCIFRAVNIFQSHVSKQHGAGSVKATNRLYNAAKRDGTEIGAIQPQAVFEPIYNHPGTRFDAKRFTWIGGLNIELSIFLGRHTSM